MRKIILSMMLSLDSFIEGPDKELDWHVVDEEFNEYAIDLLNRVDTILFGRVNYQLFESYWPKAIDDPLISKSDLEIAHRIDDINKIVYSRTLQKVEWKNTKLVRDVVLEEVLKMKEESGKDMVMYGGAGIAQSFMKLGLIDEYRLFYNPVVLGNGKPLFKNLNGRIGMNLVDVKRFDSGLVLIVYTPVI
jgi:dihydrofolate reductase